MFCGSGCRTPGLGYGRAHPSGGDPSRGGIWGARVSKTGRGCPDRIPILGGYCRPDGGTLFLYRLEPPFRRIDALKCSVSGSKIGTDDKIPTPCNAPCPIMGGLGFSSSEGIGGKGIWDLYTEGCCSLPREDSRLGGPCCPPEPAECIERASGIYAGLGIPNCVSPCMEYCPSDMFLL